MTHLEPPPRRSLQARLTLYYAAGVYAAAFVLLATLGSALVGVDHTRPVDPPPSATSSATHGISPHQLLVYSAVALAVLIPIAVALGWYIAGRFLQPLRAITATAMSISAGNLDQRLDLGQPTNELTELGHTLDVLFARLQASFDAQRHFVANASHELRTPLAGLRTLLEVTLANPNANADTLRSSCQQALALGEHQERLVQALFALATSERGVARWETIDLTRIVREALASRHEEATAHRIDLVEQLSPALISGDPKLAESLAVNLIDNAIRHNHRDGYMHVATTTCGTQATLTVCNSGPLVDEADIARLYQPFQRLSPARGSSPEGSGLGLAIAHAVAKAHHAILTTRTQPEGGLLVEVRFPPPFQSGTVPPENPATPPKPALRPSILTEDASKNPLTE